VRTRNEKWGSKETTRPEARWGGEGRGGGQMGQGGEGLGSSSHRGHASAVAVAHGTEHEAEEQGQHGCSGPVGQPPSPGVQGGVITSCTLRVEGRWRKEE
jgi:hypothetical protein